jgi:hypothetical protein
MYFAAIIYNFQQIKISSTDNKLITWCKLRINIMIKENQNCYKKIINTLNYELDLYMYKDFLPSN